MIPVELNRSVSLLARVSTSADDFPEQPPISSFPLLSTSLGGTLTISSSSQSLRRASDLTAGGMRAVRRPIWQVKTTKVRRGLVTKVTQPGERRDRDLNQGASGGRAFNRFRS